MQTLYVSFRKRENTQGIVTIYGRVTLHGKRNDFSTGITCTINEWQEWKNGKRNFLEKKLSELKGKLEEAFRKFPSFNIKQLLSFKAESGLDIDFFFLSEYYQEFQRKDGIEKSTLISYKVREKKVRQYFPKLTLKQIGSLWAEDFHISLKRKYSLNYANKIIKYISQVLRLAVRRELIPVHPFPYFRYKQKKPEIIFLKSEEVQRFENYTFNSKPLSSTANMFIFQCKTGLAYSELSKVSKANLVQEDGNYLHGLRTKSEIEYFIPLDEFSFSFLDEHNFKIKPYTNQVYNRFLKEVAMVLGIEKRLTTHVARKTAGMIWLNEGYEIEDVSLMLGHADIKTTQRWYAKVLPKRVINKTKEIRAMKRKGNR